MLTEWRIEPSSMGNDVYRIRESASPYRYWYDNEDTDDDWMTLHNDKLSQWKIIRTRYGYAIQSNDYCIWDSCKRDVTWKESVSSKFLYVGSNESVTFEILASNFYYDP